MLKWLFGEKAKPSGSLPVPRLPQQEAKANERVPDLLARLPPDTRHTLESLATRLEAMVSTPESDAERELEDRNASRRRTWGDQAVAVPLRRGSDTEVIAALLECVVADYKTGNVTRLAVEEVPAPSSAEVERVERARSQLTDMSPALRARYEKRFVRRMRKTGNVTEHAAAGIRKLNVTVYFHETFGCHEILSIGEGSYFLMPCTKR